MLTSLALLGFLSFGESYRVGDDPADSWLVYGKASGASTSDRVLSVNATWRVPSYPKTRGGGNAPGFWFGIEPVPADVLIQPILAYGDGVPDYQIFTGFFDWHNQNWVQSDTQNVVPGDEISGSIVWNSATQEYTQSIWVSGGTPISTVVSKANEHGETFTDVYFVIEHQPNSCTEYPANGGITFYDINVAWASGKKLAPSDWSVRLSSPSRTRGPNAARAHLNTHPLPFLLSIRRSLNSSPRATVLERCSTRLRSSSAGTRSKNALISSFIHNAR